MNTPFDPTLENDIKELMKEVPVPIRAFFASGKVEIVAKNLMQKYRLHIDQGAITEREIILLLLGLKSPDEFTKTLVEEAKLDQQTVNGITRDVNEQIFVPLREEMRKESVEVKPPQAPIPAVASAPPREVVLQPRTTMIPANPQLPQRPAEAYGVGGQRPAQILTSVPRYVPPKKYFNLQNKIPPRLAEVSGVGGPPTTTKPMESNKLLEDHEEPHIEFKKNPRAPKPIIKEYSSDPYREPIDEKQLGIARLCGCYTGHLC